VVLELGNGWESLGAKNQQHRQHIVNTVLTDRPEGTSGILRLITYGKWRRVNSHQISPSENFWWLRTQSKQTSKQKSADAQ
jgi:hypothetical protein